MRTRKGAAFCDWPVDRTSATPLPRQIYIQLRAAILSGALGPNAPLPSTRAMATGLAVSRATVVAAYGHLLTEGYVDSRAGSGSFVSADVTRFVTSAPRRVPRLEKPPPVPVPAQAFVDFERSPIRGGAQPFNAGRTMMDARTIEIWRKLTHQAVRSLGERELGYSDPRGFLELRQSLCEYLRTARAVRCEPDQIIVTSGTQHAIDIAIRVLLAPDDAAWVEDPGYPLTYNQLLLARTKIHPIPVDDQGLMVDAGRRSAPNARAVFVTPSHQFPTGVPLSMARRLALLDWARSSGAFIVEDDYTSEFRYSGPSLASLQGLDRDGRVIYVGTLNKALFPGLRLGYAVVPRALLPAFLNARYLIDRQPPSLYQAVMAEFLRQGHFAAHIRRMRQTYQQQRDALAETLIQRASTHLRVEVPDQGMHLVAYLRSGVSDIAVERIAMHHGIIVRALSRYYRTALPQQALMLGFSGFPRQLIIPAAARLGAVIAQMSLRRSREHQDLWGGDHGTI